MTVLAHQICKESATLANKLEQAAARVMILRESTQVFREVGDTLRQQGDLNLRGAGITLMGAVLRDDAFLRFPRERHKVLQPSISFDSRDGV